MSFRFSLNRLLDRLRALVRRRPFFLGILLCAGPLLAAGCAGLAEKERELTFRIEPGNAGWYSGLPDGLQETQVPVGSERSEQLHAWWWPAERADAPAVLYLHGARWNLTGHVFRIRQLRDFGFSVLAIDYRGFGKSGGELPSEETVYEDALAAWRHLAQLQPDPARRYIYGHSLGGAVAVDLAHRLQTDRGMPAAEGLIVESTFTTLADIARSLSYPWLPLQLLMSQKFDSVSKIAEISLPVLIVHGSADRYVPSRFSEQLYEAARGPKKLLLIDGGSHNNSMRLGAEEYRQAFGELFGWRPPQG
ncbi:MAG TPA: alpha/beta fold hydrolase [Noviherbaspirillum sp.]|jgi:alpha-beta hydrolase superfamily lysophospholipase|uniref:alpha/beta hydrolase n=1 Tax=Noviherbaspirillum sp. TaxID=1926288 RepID=UPI002F95000D